MNAEIRNALILSAALGSALWAEPKAKITAMVYNYAAVSPDVLARAERDAARIYERAGITIHWLDCPLSPESAALFPGCRVQFSPAKLALRLLRQALASQLTREEHAYGFAIMPEDGSFAEIAIVFTDETDQVAEHFDRHSGANLESGVLLGVVVAHELGHLLLGAGSHSDIGVMRANWHRKELKLIAQHTVAFTPAQVEKMRANVEARMAAEEAMAINALGASANSVAQ
jgi:hypothetical protein